MVTIGERIKFKDSKKGTVVGVLVDKKRGKLSLVASFCVLSRRLATQPLSLVKLGLSRESIA